jgi:fatty acid desaturase
VFSNNFNNCVGYDRSPADRLKHLALTPFSLTFLHMYLFLYLCGGGLSSVFTYTIYRVVQSACYMVNTQITHLHEDCMVVDNDWYAHQVRTASDHSLQSTLGELWAGGLNYQIEHHLFPNVSHWHHPNMQPIVQRVSEKHGVAYKAFAGYTDAFHSYHDNIVKLAQSAAGGTGAAGGVGSFCQTAASKKVE